MLWPTFWQKNHLKPNLPSLESVSKYGNFKLLATSGALYIKIALKNPKQTSHFSAQRYSFTAAVPLNRYDITMKFTQPTQQTNKHSNYCVIYHTHALRCPFCPIQTWLMQPCFADTGDQSVLVQYVWAGEYGLGTRVEVKGKLRNLGDWQKYETGVSTSR